jgi:hypothetical protein
MFELIYKAGKTLADSFFIGKEGENVKQISAAEVLPLDVQEKITASEEEFDNKEAEVKVKVNEDGTEVKVEGENVNVDDIQKEKGIPSPEIIAKKIAEVCKDFKGFEVFCKEASDNHAAMLKQASMKKEAKVSDPSEISFKVDEKVKPAKVTDKEVSVNEKEANADEKTGEKDGKLQKSPVKSYYGRLPGNAVQEDVKSIKLQSSLKEQYKKLSAAFEDLKKENDKTKEDLNKATEELGNAKKENEEMKGELTLNDNKKTVDSIVAEIKKIVKVQKENVFVDKLVKLDDKSLKIVLDVVKEIGKLSKDDKADKDVAGLFGDEAGKKEEKKEGFGANASAKMPGVNIPQPFSQYAGSAVSSLNGLFED